MAPAGTRSRSGAVWCWLVGAWSVIFAVPHVYWATGRRSGLGVQSAAADAAFQQTWFVAYNLATASMAAVGALGAFVLAMRWGGWPLRRWLVMMAVTASVLLVLRGALGLTLLGVDLLRGTFDAQTPAILLAIEPWFLLGGFLYGVMAHRHHAAPAASVLHR